MIEIQGVPGHELGETALAKRCADKLAEHYPGHPWAVHVNSEEGFAYVDVFNWAVSFMYGYRLMIDMVCCDPSLACIVKAGGEILERAGMELGPWNGEFAKHIEGVPEHHQRYGTAVGSQGVHHGHQPSLK